MKLPRCCGQRCGDVTTAEDATDNLRRWWCLACSREWVEPWQEPEDTRYLPLDPTKAPPGSPEKLAILEIRAAQGLPLYHSADNPQAERVPAPQTSNAHHQTRGVHKVGRKWRARIWDKLLRRKIDLGLHHTLEEALAVVAAAAVAKVQEA